MTRFARATGSKSANARAPEAATPWAELRSQLQAAQAAKDEAEKQAEFELKRKENYENFLKEHKENSIKKVWCEFENQPPSINAESTENVKIKKNKLKKMKIASLKAEKNGGTVDGAVLDSKKEDDNKKQNKKNQPPECSDEEMEADDEELVKWLNEYSDGEIQDEYNDLTSQLENILKKNEESHNKKSKTGEVDNNKVVEKKKKKKKNIVETSDEFNVSNVDNDKSNDSIEISSPKKSKKNKKAKLETSNDEGENNNISNDLSDVKKKIKKDKNMNTSISEECDENVLGNGAGNKDIKKKKKNKSKNKHIDEDNSVQTDSHLEEKTEDSVQRNNPDQDSAVNSNESKAKKKKNKKRKASECIDKSVDNCDTNMNENKKSKKMKTQSDLPATNTSDIKKKGDDAKKNILKKGETNTNNIDKNNAKKKDKKGEYARRKPLNEKKTILIVNGEEVEVTVFGGFPILSKDAERLQQLRKNLVSKGIPRSEVDRTMKLERRRAEKSLARIKKKLCFHCRKGGHNLSECPELNKKSENTGVPSSGICFKCGSTEHTHFACRVVKTQDFKFASCFICNEQGHISRQCPDNPRGLYPKGGGCRECGDVTHLKKDCPKILQLREDHTMKLDTIETNNIEDISRKQTLAKDSATKVKHVKF